MNKEEFKKKVIEEIKRIAKENKLHTVSLSIFKNNSDVSITRMWKTFNSWREAVELAGLEPDTTKLPKTKDELGENLFLICKNINGIPNIMQFQRNSKIALNSYKRNYGNHWSDILIGFKKWLKEKYPNSKFINLISNKTKIIPSKKQSSDHKHFTFIGPSKKGLVNFGEEINFRGLGHAPVNEQGVVFLFSKISEDLGFKIEAIQTDYPDCVGKRLVNANKKIYQSVAIEFEYCSSNFYQHGHDVSKCDVIVCWIHDWKECPLEVIEVIELKEVIKKLKNS